MNTAISTFNPRDTSCKSPYGAVPTGTVVSFTLRPLRREGFSEGTISAYVESQDITITHPLTWAGHQGKYDLFEGTLPAGDEVGLIWYTLILTGIDGRIRALGPYQLTVYQEESVPTWFGEGLTYQIFPDRFCRTTIPNPEGMVGNRTVHQSWVEEPVYLPDEKGEIRNRDFFGGNLAGITEKLPYLQSLGVETIYLCPIFEAPENHRYGTSDYDKIDPMLGTKEDFTTLCDRAHTLDMKIMLDGVFNHTGYVSRYFNGDGFYDTVGASQSQDSPYYPWFDFINWPEEYHAWWGIYSLPAVREDNADYQNFIFGDENSVVRRWLKAGADGWRLDVTDELPDHFVAGIHRAIRAQKPEGIIIGEVWEDGSQKIAYDVRRKHILGGHCDGLMNYPFRTSAISYLLGGDARHFMEEMETLRENYPPFAYYSAMNSLGTHDTLRILTYLGEGHDGQGWSKDDRAHHSLTPEQKALGLARLKLGVTLLYAFPGSPTLYYGDEVGMEGFEDPFNRRTFPWGQEQGELTQWFAKLGQTRKTMTPLRKGDITYLKAEGGLLAFVRQYQEEKVLCVLNRSDEAQTLEVPWQEEPMVIPPMEAILKQIKSTGDS